MDFLLFLEVEAAGELFRGSHGPMHSGPFLRPETRAS
jgi:hypothetical protein